MRITSRGVPPGDVFALRNSSLNAFLFAELGTEQNGCTLTVLSTLARLGMDPWAQAAEWARMPTAATIDGLTESILRMPLHIAGVIEARAIAGRLAALLPRQGASPEQQSAGERRGRLNIPHWLPIALAGAVLGLVIAASMYMAAPTALPPFAPTIEHGAQ
jgi:hypothetical protein